MGLVHQKYKVAVVQAAPVWLDLDATVDKTIALIEQAAAQGAKLIAFPETFIPGYPWQIWLGAPAWAIGRGFVQRYFDNLLSFDSPQDEQVHVGAWPSFSLYDPFAHALGFEVNNAASKVYAVEGSCFFLGPCAVVSQAMIDELCDSPEKHAFLHAGGGHAVIYGPDGSSLAEKLPPDQEGILYADIDLGMIGVAKNAADPAGHYSRPDVTRLLLNTTRANRVERFSLPVDAEVMSEIRLQA